MALFRFRPVRREPGYFMRGTILPGRGRIGSVRRGSSAFPATLVAELDRISLAARGAGDGLPDSLGDGAHVGLVSCKSHLLSAPKAVCYLARLQRSMICAFFSA